MEEDDAAARLAAAMDDEERVKLGACEIDLPACRVRRGQEMVHIKPRSAEVLAWLLQHPDKVCSRREIMDAVWGQSEVTEDVLNQAIRELRAALGDDSRQPRFIETLPRRGYRLLATPEAVPTNDTPASEVRWRSPLLPSLLVLAIVAAIVMFWSHLQTAPRTPTLLVLPFEYAQQDVAHIAEGLSDEITARLARETGVTVIARTTAFAFADQGLDIATMVERTGADQVLEGSVYREHSHLRIHLQLIDQAGIHLWAASLNESQGGLFATFEEAAGLVVRQVTGKQMPQQSETNSPGDVAFSRYLQAEHLRRNARRGWAWDSIPAYQEVLQLDPEFADAWAGLALVRHNLGNNPRLQFDAPQQAQELLDGAAEAARRTLALAPDHTLGMLVQAKLTVSGGNWPAAAEQFRHLLQRAPGDADVRAEYARFLYEAGYLSEGYETAREAFELDPFSPSAIKMMAHGAACQGDHDATARYLEMLAQYQEQREVIMEASLHARQGQFGEAAELMLGSDWAERGERRRWLPLVLQAMRQESPYEEATQALRNTEQRGQLEPLTGYQIYSMLGAYDDALRMLAEQRSAETQLTLWLPERAGLRRQPGFVDHLERIGLLALWRHLGPGDLCQRSEAGFSCR